MNDVKKSGLNKRYNIHSDPTKWPYGSKITLFLNGERSFKLEGATCLLVDDNYVVRFEPGSKLSVQNEIKNPEFQVWNICLEGFTTASEAEKTGIRFAASLLWSAISKNYPIRLIYNTSFPCEVYNRNASQGWSLESYCHSNYPEDVISTVEGLKEIFCSKIEIEPKLLLAMELFATAPLEITQKARFVMLITSLEALADQESYGKEVTQVIALCKAEIAKIPSVSEDIKSSIYGRLKWLA